MLINSGVCQKTYFIYSTFTYEQFQITKYKALVTVVLREGRAPARMLFHQEGSRHGLLLHGPGFLPHVGHDGELQLPDVLLAASRCRRRGSRWSGHKVLNSLAELLPPLPKAVAAGCHPVPDFLELWPLHVVEWAALPGHLVTRQLDPVSPVVHSAVQWHVVAGHVDVGVTIR